MLEGEDERGVERRGEMQCESEVGERELGSGAERHRAQWEATGQAGAGARLEGVCRQVRICNQGACLMVASANRRMMG